MRRGTNWFLKHYGFMQVSEIMTREVETIPPEASLQQAAAAMEALGVGSLPVCDGKRLVGAITDRDIVVRGVAAGISPIDGLVGDCMTEDIVYAFCDEEADEVLARMKTLQIRRLAVLDRDKTLAGIISLGDIATEPRAAALGTVGAAVAEISEPSRPRK
ncbi:MAG: CBS domain-containing protein [Enhydrobacter sp.]|nr:CBS domain-containing protein [Enhydrobacter sp.]